MTTAPCTPQRWVHIPVEIKAREFHAKAFLAACAIQRGWGVIAGDAFRLIKRAHELPAGVLIDKSLSRKRAAVFAQFHAHGHRAAAWCEEGLVYLSSEDYLRRRVAREALRELGAVFAWGPEQAALLRSFDPAVAERIHETGNPRFDILRPGIREAFAPDASRIRDEHGEFVLVNTNFGFANNLMGQSRFLEMLRNDGKIHDAQSEEFYQGWIQFKARLRGEFVALVRKLADDGLRVVVRPHPQELLGAWREDLGRCANIAIVRRGSFVPWAMAARAVIHNGCTTAVESRALGQTVLEFRPVTDPRFDCVLPRLVSEPVCSAAEVCAALDRRPPDGLPEISRRYLSSLEGPFASDRILEMPTGPIDPRAPHAVPVAAARTLRASLEGVLAVKHAAGRAWRRLSGEPETERLDEQRANRLVHAELKDWIERFLTLRGAGDRKIAVSRIEHGIYRIVPLS